MFEFYFFNNAVNNNGDHYIHKEYCAFLPDVLHRTLIGYKTSFDDAIKTAELTYPHKSFISCFFCCNPHRSK